MRNGPRFWIYEPDEHYENVPPLDAIWTVQLGRNHVENPSAAYEPTRERIAELAALPYTEYLLTPEWKERRRMAILAAEHRCNRCRTTAPLDVHHLSYDRVGGELPEDLEVLCRDCHRREHGLD